MPTYFITFTTYGARLHGDERGSVDRQVVEEAIHHVSRRRGWNLYALNVRSNHVHAVVSAQQKPEDVMVALKAWATRFLADRGLRERGSRTWAVHGSTRWLKTEAGLEAAINYVLFEQ